MSKVFGTSKPSPVFGPKGAGNNGNSEGPRVIQAYFPGGRLSETLRGWQARVGQRPVVQARREDKGHAFPTPPGFLKNRAPGSGQPLQAMVKSQMESFFQTDFSNVRVHVGPEAPSIGALAFTVGTNLYFAPGQYQPNTPGGRQLIGHELTHVVQQRQGRVANPYGSGLAVVHDPGLEEEAEQQGTLAAKHPGRGRSEGGHVQRRTVGKVDAEPSRGGQHAGSKPQRTVMQRQTGKSSELGKGERRQVFQASFVGGRPPARLLVQRHAGHLDSDRSGLLELPQSFLRSLSAQGGGPLPPAVQAKMEKELGADFSAVRVHVGSQSAKIGALAFTAGSDIYFGPGQFQPTTSIGEQLLRLRLNQVVQHRIRRLDNLIELGAAVTPDSVSVRETGHTRGRGWLPASFRICDPARSRSNQAENIRYSKDSGPAGSGGGEEAFCFSAAQRSPVPMVKRQPQAMTVVQKQKRLRDEAEAERSPKKPKIDRGSYKWPEKVMQLLFNELLAYSVSYYNDAQKAVKARADGFNVRHKLSWDRIKLALQDAVDSKNVNLYNRIIVATGAWQVNPVDSAGKLPRKIDNKQINTIANNENNVYFGRASVNQSISDKLDLHAATDPTGEVNPYKDDMDEKQDNAAPPLVRQLSPVSHAHSELLDKMDQMPDANFSKETLEEKEVIQYVEAHIRHYSELLARCKQQKSPNENYDYAGLERYFEEKLKSQEKDSIEWMKKWKDMGKRKRKRKGKGKNDFMKKGGGKLING